MLRVVIDTNLLIDGSVDAYNYGNRIIDAVIAEHIEAYANRATLRENKFISPQKLADPNYLNKLQYFFDKVKITESSQRLNLVEDPEDNKLLESAQAAFADYLVTSDQHLLKLEKFGKTKIVRPAEFWNIYQDGTSDGWRKWLKDFITS